MGTIKDDDDFHPLESAEDVKVALDSPPVHSHVALMSVASIYFIKCADWLVVNLIISNGG